MRLVTGISIVSLMVSVVTLALVLMLFMGEQWESAETEDQMYAPPTVVAVNKPQLTREIMLGLLLEYLSKNARQQPANCLYDDNLYYEGPDAGRKEVLTRMDDLGISFSQSQWTIQASGRFCNGLETFTIDDATGEVTHVEK